MLGDTINNSEPNAIDTDKEEDVEDKDKEHKDKEHKDKEIRR